MLNIQSICIFFDEKPRSQRKDEGKTFALVFHQVRNFIKKETLAQVFSSKFWKIFKSIFLQNTAGRMPLNSYFYDGTWKIFLINKMVQYF